MTKWEEENRQKVNEVLVNYNWSPVNDYKGSMFYDVLSLLDSQRAEIVEEIKKQPVYGFYDPQRPLKARAHIDADDLLGTLEQLDK
jgi:hypothetical protein